MIGPNGRVRLLNNCAGGAYWYPVYCFVRRKGHESEARRDLTQEFFARLIEKRYISGADRSLGRFGTFLLTATLQVSAAWIPGPEVRIAVQ